MNDLLLNLLWHMYKKYVSNTDSVNFDWKAIFLQNDLLILRRYVSYMLHISSEWSVKNILRHTTKWSEYYINSVNNVSSEQLLYVSDYKSSYSFTTHYSNHVSSSSMCFAPSQSYRQNVTTPQLWLWLVFLMHGTHSHVLTNKNCKTTHISFHSHRQWWYLQTQRTWIIHVNKAPDNIHEIPLDFKTVLSHEKHQSRGNSDEENPANGACSSHDWSLRNDELLVRIVRNQCYDRCRFCRSS